MSVRVADGDSAAFFREKEGSLGQVPFSSLSDEILLVTHMRGLNPSADQWDRRNGKSAKAELDRRDASRKATTTVENAE